jgi:hypothetical protein
VKLWVSVVAQRGLRLLQLRIENPPQPPEHTGLAADGMMVWLVSNPARLSAGGPLARATADSAAEKRSRPVSLWDAWPVCKVSVRARRALFVGEHFALS